MNCVKYAIGKIMTDKFQTCYKPSEVVDFLNRTGGTNGIEVSSNHFEVILNSMNELHKSGLSRDLITGKDISDFESEWNQFLEFINTVNDGATTNAEILARVTKMYDEFDRQTNICKNLVEPSWSKLTDISKMRIGDNSLDFAFLARSVSSHYYVNEMQYPTISTSLLFNGCKATYECKRRHVMILYPMSIDKLIFMSVIDANTAALFHDTIESFKFMNMPFSARIYALSANTGPGHCGFMTYDNFCDKVNSNEVNEIVFTSDIKPAAVMYTSKADDYEISWATGYASVYSLPLLEYDCDRGSVKVLRDDSCYR